MYSVVVVATAVAPDDIRDIHLKYIVYHSLSCRTFFFSLAHLVLFPSHRLFLCDSEKICARHLMKWRTTRRRTRHCSRKRIRKAGEQTTSAREKKLRRATKRFSELLCQFSDGSHCETGTSAVFSHFLLFSFIWKKNARVKFLPPSTPVPSANHVLLLTLAVPFLCLIKIIRVEFRTKRWNAHFNYYDSVTLDSDMSKVNAGTRN